MEFNGDGDSITDYDKSAAQSMAIRLLARGYFGIRTCTLRDFEDQYFRSVVECEKLVKTNLVLKLIGEEIRKQHNLQNHEPIILLISIDEYQFVPMEKNEFFFKVLFYLIQLRLNQNMLYELGKFRCSQPLNILMLLLMKVLCPNNISCV